MRPVDELRPLSAGRLLAIRREVCAGTEDALERGALCNARVLAECCFYGGEPAFADAGAVLDALTFPEMEELLRRWRERKPPAAVNPQFDEARFAQLREEGPGWM